MKSEHNNERAFDRFAAELKKDADESRIDYTAIENRLFERIQSAAELGPLAILKIDEIPSESMLDHIEDELMARVHTHVEFEEPVNECIGTEAPSPAPDLKRAGTTLFNRIAKAERLPAWERLLIADEIVTSGRWESIEAALETRIENHSRATAAVKQSFFMGLGMFMGQVRTRAAAVTLTILVAVSAISFSLHNHYFAPITSMVYQVQSMSDLPVQSVFAGKATLSTEKAGAVTLINKKGFIELSNGGRLKIIRANNSRFDCAVSFAQADRQLVGTGMETFFVNKQRSHERFSVHTADYRIDVVGTYFTLQPDLSGHVSLAVKEGQVKVAFANGDIQTVVAGGTLSFDLSRNTYTINTNGFSIRRDQILMPPSITELRQYRQLFVSSTPAGADVRIDGRHAGITPMAILQPAGNHMINLEKNGYRFLDTTVAITAIAAESLMIALQPEESAPAADTAVAPVAKKYSKNSRHTLEARGPTASEKTFRDAEAAAPHDWRRAIELYRIVIDDSAASPLKREAALFYTGRLVADHGNENGRANSIFEQYVKRYPNGFFTGESLLRLAEIFFASNPDRAIQYYRTYFEKYPRNYQVSELQYRVGLMYLQQKKYDEAIDLFKQSLANMPDNNEVRKSTIYSSLYKAIKEKGEKESPASAGIR